MYRLQTVGGFGGKSDQLNAYNIFVGDPAFFERDLARYLTVTPAEVAAATAQYLQSAQTGVFERGPDRAPFAGAGRFHSSPWCTEVADRSQMPLATADATFAFPTIHKSHLANGLAVWSVRHGALPVATMVLLVRAGSSADTGGTARAGLAHGRHAR